MNRLLQVYIVEEDLTDLAHPRLSPLLSPSSLQLDELNVELDNFNQMN
jgi:hypothetical protein